MRALWGALMGNWAIYLAAVATAAAGGLLVLLLLARAELARQEGERKLLELELGVQAGTIAGYRKSVAACNQALEALKAAGDENARRAAQELARAQQANRTGEPRLQRAAARLVSPTPPGEGCSQAVQRIRDELKP